MRAARSTNARSVAGTPSWTDQILTSRYLPSTLLPCVSQGYFVGRKELTAWVQQFFQPNFSKVEECASGVVYCQILDSIYPGAVQMGKVKMNAKTEVDFLHNFKILQTAFSKKKIDRFIEVDKLVKKSFQFNMEFLQFMKCYWDMHAPNGDSPQGGAFADAAVENHPPSVEKPARAAKPDADAPAKREAAAAAKGMAGGPKRVGGTGPNQRPATGAKAGGEAAGAAAASSEAQQQLALEVTELKLSVENLERERDFYYSKLREVEVLCQANEGETVPFLQQVLDILYKTDDADEFVTPSEEEVIAAN